LVPQVADPCAPATTTVPSVTTLATTNSTVPSATTTVSSATTTVPSATTTVPSATTTVAPSTTTVAATTTTSTTTTTTTIALTCATGGACVVGDAGPGGGIIFYDAGSIQSWGRYLEVACVSWQNNCVGTTADPQAVWGCQGTDISGADGTAIGTGKQNTTDIVNGCVTSDITAAELAAGYSHNTLDDWFLPSEDELNQMYTNLHSASTPLGGFLADVYWSSSEEDDIWVRLQFFNTGSLGSSLKAAVFYVRPVRAF